MNDQTNTGTADERSSAVPNGASAEAPQIDTISGSEPADGNGSAASADAAVELAAARAEAKANYDKFLYAMADFENYKKRIERQIGEIALSGKKSVLTKMLPVLDNLERAVAFEDSDGLRGGLQATLRMFESALAGEGVKSVSLKGRRFDPKLAEAIATQPAPAGVAEDTVLDEAHKAYTIGDEVLRPAQVVVAKNA